MLMSQKEVKALPLESYQEDVLILRRKQLLCPHNKIEVNLDKGHLQCADCDKRWE